MFFIIVMDSNNFRIYIHYKFLNMNFSQEWYLQWAYPLLTDMHFGRTMIEEAKRITTE